MSAKPISPYYQDSILEITKLKAELESLRQENSQLRTALSSGLCSAHQEPDPLHCDMCNGIKCFFNANASLVEENSRLREALEFYADAENYHAIAFLFDPPCGGFAEDFDTDFNCYGTGGGQYDRPMPGKAARAALNPPKRS